MRIPYPVDYELGPRFLEDPATCAHLELKKDGECKACGEIIQ